MKFGKRILLFLTLAVYNGSLIVFSLCFRSIIDALTGNDKAAFLNSILFAIVVIVIQIISFYCYSIFKNLYVKGEILNLKVKIINRLLYMTGSEFRKKDVSEYISLIFNDLNQYEQNIILSKIEMAEHITLVIFAGIGIVFIYPFFLLVVACVAIAGISIPCLLSKKVDKWNCLLSAVNESSMKHCMNFFHNINVIRAGKYTGDAVLGCASDAKYIEAAKCKVKDGMILIQGSLLFLTTALTLTIFVLGGTMVFREMLSVGALFALIQLLFYMTNPIIGIMTTISKIHSVDSIKKKIEEILSGSTLLINDGIEKVDISIGIRIKDLEYRYTKNEALALKTVNCFFEKGKKYALVGDNGSGKSTLLKLIAGYFPFDSYEGEILFDTVPLKNLSENSIWRILSFIEQEDDLLDLTIKKNIKLGHDDKKEIDNYWINQLNMQNLYDSGARRGDDILSGGEKQKVVFLRELYRQPGILLADEPDSALDIKSSEGMMNIILQLDCTCIIITHKITEKLRNFDEVLVMKEGQIEERGTYDELLEKRGELYKLKHSKGDINDNCSL